MTYETLSQVDSGGRGEGGRGRRERERRRPCGFQHRRPIHLIRETEQKIDDIDDIGSNLASICRGWREVETEGTKDGEGGMWRN